MNLFPYISDSKYSEVHSQESMCHDLMMMENSRRGGDDTNQDSVCNMDATFFDSRFSQPRPETERRDPLTKKPEPLWMNFDNGDVFYSSTGEFPSMSDLTEEEDHPSSSASCCLPYPKRFRRSPSCYEDLSSFSSSYLPSRNSPPHHDDKTSESNVLDLVTALQDLQYQGVVGSGLVHPRQPVFAVDEKTCALCKKNGEAREFYTTHVLKDNRGKIICPILRKYVCPTCGASGDRAHTLRHCPVNKAAEDTK